MIRRNPFSSLQALFTARASRLVLPGDPKTVKSIVATSRVAPAILKALGLDATDLRAVQKEGTQVLPFLFGDGDPDDF